MAVKERGTIKQKVATELSRAGILTESPVSPAIEKSHSTDDPSGMTVGSKFQFSYAEIARIKVVVEEYDKQANQARRNLVSLNISPMPVDAIRSRCALITEKMEVATDIDVVELNHTLRVTLGDALSLHARKLARIQDKTLPSVLVDTNDIEKAEEAARHIANKIGEQLTMHLETEGDD